MGSVNRYTGGKLRAPTGILIGSCVVPVFAAIGCGLPKTGSEEVAAVCHAYTVPLSERRHASRNRRDLGATEDTKEQIRIAFDADLMSVAGENSIQ